MHKETLEEVDLQKAMKDLTEHVSSIGDCNPKDLLELSRQRHVETTGLLRAIAGELRMLRLEVVGMRVDADMRSVSPMPIRSRG